MSFPMPSIFYRGFRYVIRHTWDLVNPRAIAWKYIKKRYPNKPIITKLGKDLKVRIYTHDVVDKDIYANGMFEKAESNFVTKFLKPGMVFFDVGANLGQYTLLVAHRAGTSGRSFRNNCGLFYQFSFTNSWFYSIQ